MVYPTRRLPFEQLTTIDERVDFVHNQLSDAQLALNRLLGKEGLPAMAEITREVSLRETVPPGQGTRAAKSSPLTGRIVQIIRHWPRGCRSIVNLAVGHGDLWVLPNLYDNYVAMDDATPVVTVSEPIQKGEEIWAIIRNGDGANPHTISVTALIVGVE